MTVTLEPRGNNETFMTIHHGLLPPDLIDQHQSGVGVRAAQYLAANHGKDAVGSAEIAGSGL